MAGKRQPAKKAPKVGAVKKSPQSKKVEESRINPDDFNLSETDRKILDYKLRFPELTQKQIASFLDIGEQWVSHRVNTPAFKEAHRYYTQAATEIIVESKNEAARTLRELLNCSNDNVRLRAAEAILMNELKAANGDSIDETIERLTTAFETMVSSTRGGAKSS